MASAMACESTMNLKDLELRSVIKFLTEDGKMPKEIRYRINTVYGAVLPSYYEVTFWTRQFKWGGESIEFNSRSGRPVEASSKEVCQKWRM